MAGLPINIDITDFSSSFNFSQQESEKFIEDALRTIVGQFVIFWNDAADKSLHQTRSLYKKSIYIKNIAYNKAEVGLSPGFLQNAIELGCAPFDEKIGFANSSKRKTKKDGGWYITIPFKLATPESLGESESFSGVMPTGVHKALISKSNAGDKTQLKLGEIPEQFRAPKVRERIELPNGKIFEEYINKTSIYQGLQKSSIPSHSGYTSFRRVSDINTGSNDSFIHTGIVAYNLSGQAMTRLEGEGITNLLNPVVENFLSNR